MLISYSQRKHWKVHQNSCKGAVSEKLKASNPKPGYAKRKGPGNPNIGKKKAKKGD